MISSRAGHLRIDLVKKEFEEFDLTPQQALLNKFHTMC